MIKLFIVLVVVLGVVAISHLVRVYELTSKLRGKREENISMRDNKLNASLFLVFMLVFYGAFIYLMARYGNGGLGPAASEHGERYDWLMNINMIVVIAVFFVTNTLLFVFAFKYKYDPNRKALFFPHNNKLELIWTVVPSIVLTAIIILGLKEWNKITDWSSTEAQVIELYSKQFSWTARYSGEDNKLGKSDIRLIGHEVSNSVGVVTKKSVETTKIAVKEEIHRLDSILSSSEALYIPDEERKTMLKSMHVLQKKYTGLIELGNVQTDELDQMANNDLIVGGELYLVKGTEYIFRMRSQDVIHSAYVPHFRQQMNTVPGMITTMKFRPIYTTEEMAGLTKEKYDNINRLREGRGKEPVVFEYFLYCNKICGSAHSNMKMIVKVVEQQEYDKWIASKKTFENRNATDAPVETVKTAEASIEIPVSEEEAVGGSTAGE